MPDANSEAGSVSKVSVHKPVLLNEVVEGLVSSQNLEVTKCVIKFLDGTLGGAGHAMAMTRAIKGLKVIGLDQDPQAIERAEKIFSEQTGQNVKVILEVANFRNLDKILDKHNIKEVNMILLDLGISSDELETSGKGFSFQKEEPLYMTMGDPTTYPFTASTIVNEWKEEDIANVIFGYGEDRYARRIAKAIVTYRDKKKIETTTELAEIVKMAVPIMARGFWNGRKSIHPATKTFQALRIAVNDELNALKEGLTKGYERLAKGGRMAVISFHSLEDRIVKTYFREMAKQGHITGAGKGAIDLTKKPITATAEEILNNPRSRSAKLRIIQKL